MSCFCSTLYVTDRMFSPNRDGYDDAWFLIESLSALPHPAHMLLPVHAIMELILQNCITICYVGALRRACVPTPHTNAHTHTHTHTH